MADRAAGFCIWFMTQFAVILGYVMAHPEIKNVSDLKGKPVGVTRFGAFDPAGQPKAQ